MTEVALKRISSKTFMSSPTHTSAAVAIPPVTINAPVVVLEVAVASVIVTAPSVAVATPTSVIVAAPKSRMNDLDPVPYH